MKNIAFLLLFFLLVSGHTNANAVGGSIGGWNVVSNVASGIGAKITATKEVLVNGARTTVTGTANIMPDPSNMGKFMARLGGAAIVSEAVNQLFNGVDYVMDPANNTITKRVSPQELADYYKYNLKTVWAVDFSDRKTWGQTAGEACANTGRAYPVTYKGVGEGCTFPSGTRISVNQYNNSSYAPDGSTKPQSATYPIAEVASQVLDQAEKDIKAGNPASPAVALSRAVAQDMIQQAEADDVKARPIAQQLGKNPEYPSENDAEGEITKPEVKDPATGEVVKPAETSSIAMKFPEACKWFPQACLFIDWMMQDYQEETPPELPKEELDKKDIDEDLIKLNGSSCPAPLAVSIDLPMFNTTYTDSIDVSEYCSKIEALAPVLQLISIVIAVMILARI